MNLTMQQAYMIVYGMFGCLALMFAFVIYWMNKHEYTISISTLKEGAMINTGGRARVKKDGKFYPMHDFFGGLSFLGRKIVGKPFKGFFYGEVKDYVNISEGIPIIGAKYSVELQTKVFKGLTTVVTSYVPWQPPEITGTEGIIQNIRVVKINALREDIWESTDMTSKADMLYKVVVPSLLIILALACIIFFPKIYNTIVEPTKDAIAGALGNWQDMLDKAKPLG